MDAIFNDFSAAYPAYNGYMLSKTLSPIAPPGEPNRLSAFFKSTNFNNAKTDFKYRLLYDKKNPLTLGAEEGNGWVELFFAYWKAVGEVLKAEEAVRTNSKVWLDVT
jgi:hypothetical protein